MSKTVRGWEKPKPVVATSVAAAVAPTAVAATVPVTSIDINSIVKGFSKEETQSHRQAYMHLMQSLSGTAVDVDISDGRTAAGVFYTATPFKGEQQRIVLKTARVLKTGVTDAHETTEPLSTIFVDMKDIVVVRTNKLNLQTKNYNHEFATDSTIKKHGDMSSLDGRRLENVSSSWLDPTTDTSLGTSMAAPDGRQWDQFAANKQLFNVTSSYDENLYTKKLDMSKMSREQIAHADRMAREIEGTASTNIHMKQERGQAMEEEISEEDLFSGVLTRPAAAAAAPVPVNPWTRGAKFATTSTAPVSAGPPGVGLKGNKGASSPASKSRPVPAAVPVVPVQSVSPTKMPLLSAPPNLPPPPKLNVIKALPGLSPSPVTSIEGNSASASVEVAAPEAAKTVEVAAVVAASEVVAVAATPEVPEVKPVSKPLNAGAKEFVFKFNPAATAWTPPASFKPPATPVAAPPVVTVPQTPPQQHLQPQQVPQQMTNFPPMAMSSPVQIPQNGPPNGGYVPYPSPAGNNNVNNNNGNDYKSPAQVPIAITQSPSGGPMLMPPQPNFMYGQMPPEFQMQFAIDPNTGMMAPQQMLPGVGGGQWMMPQGMPGQVPFDPRGIPMMGFPQGFPVPQTPQEQQFLMQQGLVPPPIMMSDGQFMAPPPWAMQPMQPFGQMPPPPGGEQGVGFPNPLMNATPQQIQAMMQGQQQMFMQPPGGYPGFLPPQMQGFHPQQQQMMQQQILQQQQQQGNGGGSQNAGGNGGYNNQGGNQGNNNYHRDNNQQSGGGGGQYNNNNNKGSFNDRNNNSGGRGGGRYNNNNSYQNRDNRERYNNNNSSNSNFRDRDRNSNNSNSQPGTPGGNREGGREAHSNFAKEGSTPSSASAAASTGSPAAATGSAPSGGAHEESGSSSVNASISAEPLSTPSK